MKYLGISLTEKVWHIYTENYKTLLEEIKGLNNRMTFHILMEEVILLRCQYSTNWSTDSVIPTKIPAVSFFQKLTSSHSNVYKKCKGPRIAKTIL